MSTIVNRLTIDFGTYFSTTSTWTKANWYSIEYPFSTCDHQTLDSESFSK